MNTQAIPKNQPALIAFSARALAGLQVLGPILSIAQNTAPRFATDHYDLVGEPGPAGNPGKQAVLNTKRHAVTVAQAARREALETGRKFCSDAVDLLKPHLGRTWNALWQVAGFSRFSIATATAHPYPVLLELRNFFRANPARENVPDGITADLADAKATAIQAAEQAVDAAKSARTNAAAARDAAVRQLQRRLRGLREELDLILSDTDHRWYDFGFSRPIDSRLPDPVTELIATPGLPGSVLVQYAPSTRALDYRVKWKVQGSTDDPIEVGLFADLAVNLAGLPTGSTIVISVTARNDSGETLPTEVTVVVP